MNAATRKRILDVMKNHNVMTIATLRPDGYPQATTVTYANDGLGLYFGCDSGSQKVRNIARNRKVSLTIDRDEKNWNRIRGISLGGRARILERDDREFRRGVRLLKQKFARQLGKLGDEDMQRFAVVKVEPAVISLLDYTKGLGHTELVKV